MISKDIHRYCKTPELIENYDLAVKSDEVWHCHHRLEDNKEITREVLRKRNLLWNRPPEELIFLPANQHLSEHNKERLIGHEVSEETRMKISEANRGRKLTEEQRKAISESNKGANNHNFGKHFSEEHRRKIGDAQRGEKGFMWGKHLSEETKNKISEKLTGTTWSDEERKNHEWHIQSQMVRVAQYTKDGVLVAIHDSMHAAADSVGGSPAHICQCCKGERKYHLGYGWRYVA